MTIKRFRPLVATVAALALTTSLAACTSSEKEAAPAASEATSTAAEQSTDQAPASSTEAQAQAAEEERPDTSSWQMLALTAEGDTPKPTVIGYSQLVTPDSEPIQLVTNPGFATHGSYEGLEKNLHPITIARYHVDDVYSVDQVNSFVTIAPVGQLVNDGNNQKVFRYVKPEELAAANENRLAPGAYLAQGDDAIEIVIVSEEPVNADLTLTMKRKYLGKEMGVTETLIALL